MKQATLKQDPAKERILKATVRLFYERGYSDTGINEILSEAEAFKKSLYRYFPSKKDLGISYVTFQEDQIIGLAEVMMNKYEKYEDFVRAWIRFIQRRLRTTYRYGCPLANFAVQTRHEPALRERILESIDRWNRSFTIYFSRPIWKKKKTLNSKIALEFSEKAMFLYQGAMQLYGATGNKKFIDRLEMELLKLEESV